MDSSKKKITIFYDGQCTMCSSLISTITTSTKQEQFIAKDMHTSILPKSVTLEDINKEIYVTDSHGVVYKNADAILKILEEYFNLRHLTTIGRLPLLCTVLTFGYNIVATNRHLVTGDLKNIFWTKVTVAVACIASLLISSKLWVTERVYPLTPVASFLPEIHYPFDYVVYGIVLLILLRLLCIPKPQKSIWVCVFLISILMVLDQSRLQPWAVQYLFILVTLGIFSWKKDDTLGRISTLTLLKIIVAGTYLYSGLQKINLGFMADVMPWLLQPVTSLLPSMNVLVPLIAISAPFIQIFFAIGLLTQKYRRVSLILAVSMHIFILMMIGPLGHNWNAVVWPWTIAMAILDVILFRSKDTISLKEIIFSNLNLPKVIIILFFIILPLLSFFNKWDSYLSSALYSGNITSGQLYIGKNEMDILPSAIRNYFTPSSTTTYVADISTWSMQELHVPSYPEKRIFKNVAKKICTVTNNSVTTRLHIQEYRMFNSVRNQVYTCSQLQ